MNMTHHLLALALFLLLLPTGIFSLKFGVVGRNPIRRLVRDAKAGYGFRMAADPSFLAKSVAEVFLAAGTQLAAEWERRGPVHFFPELDFVAAGVLTAIAGKYYSMWRVAPTTTRHTQEEEESSTLLDAKESTLWGQIQVPTNAFQLTLLDGVTKPTLAQRLGSFVLPVVPLFRAGFIASTVGYGLVNFMILLRSMLVPGFVSQTRSVNVLHASLYTGAFMAIEPLIDRCFRHIPVLQAALVFAARIANGLLGSILAISGMKWLGLQRLK